MLSTADDLRYQSNGTNKGLVQKRVLELVLNAQTRLKALSKVTAPPWKTTLTINWFASTPPEQIAQRVEIQLTHLGFRTVRDIGRDGRVYLTVICEAPDLEPPVIPPKPKTVGVLDEVKDAISISQVNLRKTGIPATSLYPSPAMPDLVTGAPQFGMPPARPRGRPRKDGSGDRSQGSAVVVDPRLFRDAVVTIPKPGNRNS